MTEPSQFTGRARRKKTHWSVRFGDHASKWMITLGGLGTIAAVFTVGLFLIWVAAPLLMPAQRSAPASYPGTTHPDPAPLRAAEDEFRLIGWTLHPDTTLTSFRADNGEVLHRERLFEHPPTAASFAIDNSSLALAFPDGSLQLGHPRFVTTFTDADQAPPAWQDLDRDSRLRAEQAMVQRISPTQFRAQTFELAFDDPFVPDTASPVALMDHVSTPQGTSFAVLHASGEVFLYRTRARKNLLTGKVTVTAKQARLPVVPQPDGVAPAYLRLTGLADYVLLIWDDGRVARYSVRDLNRPELVETTRVLDDDRLRLTACEWLLGRTTLLCGDSSGRVQAWFAIRPLDESGREQAEMELAVAHTFPGAGTPVTSLASSARMRMIGIGYADGHLALRHATSEKRLGTLQFPDTGSAVHTLAFAPKDDGLLAGSAGHLATWNLDAKHPEATLGALFGRVWYEGASSPEHVWQSSAATDDFEPKFGLMPLIFGTIKATVFSLLFGVPIALLAAIYTSEFLHPKTKIRIKPYVELMASLPSVVLGFLAALVLAPVVARDLTAYIALGFTVPLSFLLGAYLWQLLPHTLSVRMRRYRFPAMFLAIPVAVVMARFLGPVMEQTLFAGDIIRWLDGQIGTASGGWFLVLLPLCALIAAPASARWVSPRVRHLTADWSHSACGLADGIKFLLVALATLLAAWLLGLVLNTLGLDMRGGLYGTFVQRNALVVGFVMGFAIIPIIYTISEDALSAVPEHLRSASLGCGATPWQTAIRIIIPTAMSGLFSAIMIGLGRAVGETMIVLMAAGNTPVMDWNIFNGFRTLSANIAVELPEAVRNSTHYRTLFLAALTLFIMTFLLNTAAEIVRIRFRRKSIEL